MVSPSTENLQGNGDTYLSNASETLGASTHLLGLTNQQPVRNPEIPGKPVEAVTTKGSCWMFSQFYETHWCSLLPWTLAGKNSVIHRNCNQVSTKPGSFLQYPEMSKFRTPGSRRLGSKVILTLRSTRQCKNTENNSAPAQNWKTEEPDRLIMAFSNSLNSPVLLPMSSVWDVPPSQRS